MATNNFILRCKTEKGPFTLTELDCDSTVAKLKSGLEKLTQIRPETMRILSGYPPKPLVVEREDLKLSEVNILSGDTLIIESRKVPERASSPVIEASGSSMGDFMLHQSGIMMRHVVPSDNSCLFTSVNYILSNGNMDPNKGADLRNIIAKIVQNNTVKYNAAFLGKPNDEYCAWILNSDHWGGAIELAILSEHFKLEIVALDTLNLKAHRFGENNSYSNRIFLIYDGIHYDPLILELGNNCQTVFPSSDPRPLEMAMEIAKEAKSSRQFTDIANFSLSCKICKAELCGDKEARDHAVATGHCEFGEL